MDEELLELQRQFEFAQQAKSSIRLSERNVVELVQKLQQLQIIDFDLLHTTSKEYITPVTDLSDQFNYYLTLDFALFEVNLFCRCMCGFDLKGAIEE